jgi:RNA polymerase sigma-70 factor, ECF subfamily
VERDEKHLVRDVLDGDLGAFREIVERHQSRVFYLGLRFLKRFEDAEDFAQEVFLKAFEKIATFKGDGPFAAWLYRIAFNLGITRYRNRMKTSTVAWLEEIDADATAAPADGNTGAPQSGPSGHPGTVVELELINEESRETVRRAVDQLSDRAATIVKMHYYDGLTYEQISDALGVPVNTIKSHVFRAKQEIRERMADYMKE